MVSWIEGILSLGASISQREKPGIIAEAKKHQYNISKNIALLKLAVSISVELSNPSTTFYPC
jgi:hypothetical protein